MNMPKTWELPEFEENVFFQKKHHIALVIPVINEGERIQLQLEKLHALNYEVDIVIADGGSCDGSLSQDFLRGLSVRALLTKTGKGKLSAQLRMAYAWCVQEGYSGIITVDGNNKDSMASIPLFSQKLNEGYDYIQGSRYMKGGKAINTPLERTIGNRCIHSPWLSLMSGNWHSDTTNGFRAYSSKFLTDNNVAPFREVFQVYELLFYLTVRAGRLKYKVCNVPVERRYPVGVETPTKIKGFKGKVCLLQQMFLAGVGFYNPKKEKV